MQSQCFYWKKTGQRRPQLPPTTTTTTTTTRCHVWTVKKSKPNTCEEWDRLRKSKWKRERQIILKVRVKSMRSKYYSTGTVGLSFFFLSLSLSFCPHRLRSPCPQLTDSRYVVWPVNPNKQHKLLAKQSPAGVIGLKLTKKTNQQRPTWLQWRTG